MLGSHTYHYAAIIQKIREAEIGTGSQTPIIAATANASSDIRKRCFEVGMNDYTTKPINFKLPSDNAAFVV